MDASSLCLSISPASQVLILSPIQILGHRTPSPLCSLDCPPGRRRCILLAGRVSFNSLMGRGDPLLPFPHSFPQVAFFLMEENHFLLT